MSLFRKLFSRGTGQPEVEALPTAEEQPAVTGLEHEPAPALPEPQPADPVQRAG
jgi:hypothetical protein